MKRFRKIKGLIVDDSEMVSEAIRTQMRDLNIELVGIARTGKEALELFRRKKPDLITMDINMPVMDGVECTEQILRLDPTVRVIIVSAASRNADVLAALKAGAANYIHKPFSRNRIRAAFMDEIQHCVA